MGDVKFLQLPAGVTLDDLNTALFGAGAPTDWSGEIVSTGGFSVGGGRTGCALIDPQAGACYVGVGEINPFIRTDAR